MRLPSPSKSAVWRGVILGSVVDAVLAADAGSYLSMTGWDRNHYVLVGGDEDLAVALPKLEAIDIVPLA
jgi:hypothetical protein